ncbi:hypothetical protein CVT24_004149 [Panaeolus cyanescens]|uniref:Man(5)GlcNAc(2)-PP-dolichol translocation protein RFT1 n=1 Tax=Panaeolus cyanescens TaxID=181874 RepID=A0A409Y6T9_9AGAR|nr:hypothetical protein CVT24_004149 [Panaeolus cyanescens]
MASLVQKSILTASSLMALQLVSRLFTFGLNQALFRLASPAAYGAAAIQFELILSSILFLSREGVRNAILRAPKRVNEGKVDNERARQDNLSFLPMLVGIPLALFTSVTYAHFAAEEVKNQPYFSITIALYAIAAVGELFSEPMYNLAMSTLQTSVRVRAEGLAISAKSIATLLVLVYDAKRQHAQPGELGLISFAVGQLAYSTVLFLSYLVNFGMAAIFPGRPADAKTIWTWIDYDLFGLSLTMTSQSVVKHFLTEGDKFVLSAFSPLEDQGGYAMAVNYGSLIARIIFQPIEETLRLFFSRTLNAVSNSSHTTNKPSSESTQAITSASRTLSSLLTIQTAFSILLVVFGSSYLPLVLPIMLPRSFLHTSAPRVLSAWVWYIPFLALNGGLEAFFTSVATSSHFMNQSRWMVLFSMLYIGSAIILYRAGFGDASLVYANIINLSARIAYCLNFTTIYFNSTQNSTSSPVFSIRRSLLPSWAFVLSVAISRAVIAKSEAYFKPLELVNNFGRGVLFQKYFIAHVAVGGCLGLACLGVWWMTTGRHMKLSMPSRTSRNKTE